ncbi:MAG: class I SAM-dependent methyltransferase [Bryobacteraceae bacterium]
MNDSGGTEFFAAAGEMISRIEAELGRVPVGQRGAWRALDAGCGDGRLMRPLSRHFVEIHGVDFSGDAIARARETLADISNARIQVAAAANFAPLEDESFEFVYSHSALRGLSREAVVSCLREMRRVLKAGGLLIAHLSGFSSAELLEFAGAHDFQVLSTERHGSSSTWTTWRKQAAGWVASEPGAHVRIRRITNAFSTEPVAPCRGRFAAISIWVENLPADAGLQHLQAMVGNSFGTVYRIGPPVKAGTQAVNVILPELEATGLLPVELLWLGRSILPLATLRVIPPGPPVPRILTIGRRVEARRVKLALEEVQRPHEIEVLVDGLPAGDLEFVCTDPRPQRFDVNCLLPESIAPGAHKLEVRLGRRKFPPAAIEVTA